MTTKNDEIAGAKKTMAYKEIDRKREYHRNYMREYRRFLKEHHFCAECKKQDAFTIAGRYYCADCWEKRHGHPFEVKEKKPPTEYHIRKDWEEAGLCRFCGSPVKEGKPVWNIHADRFHMCENHYRTFCEAARKGREGRLRPLWPTFSPTEKAIKNLGELKRRRSLLLKELETSGKSTQTSEK